MTKLRFLILIIPLILLAQNSLAHLASGKDTVVGNYLVDFGYYPAEVKAGVDSYIAVNLVNKTTYEPIDSDKVLVRISNGKKLIFAATLKPENKNVVFEYIFQKPGNYNIEGNFYKNETAFVSSSFNLLVSEEGYTPFILAVFVLCIACYLFGSKLAL